MLEPKDRIILALDVDSAEEAVQLVHRLRKHVGAFKVGLELVHAAGSGVFAALREAGAERLFYDAKLHDIPNTVAGAMRAIEDYRLWMINVHASGGGRMIRAAVDALREQQRVMPPLLLGVTLLTSLAADELANELHVGMSVVDYVVAMAKLTQAAGGQGVVASPHEIQAVRDACGPGFLIVTPGVRPAGVDAGDQRRTLTPAEALRRGADYLVIGRAITAAADPTDAAARILDEMAQV